MSPSATALGGVVSDFKMNWHQQVKVLRLRALQLISKLSAVAAKSIIHKDPAVWVMGVVRSKNVATLTMIISTV
ncbi:MAG: hypothetical protein AAFR58_16345 [Cyanobacteria bacterium J06627_28]